MSIKKIIEDALNPIAPTFPLRYSGTATTFITFFKYLKQGEAWAEDKEIDTGHYYQIDIWQKPASVAQPDVWDLEALVETALKAKEFYDFTAQDLYEDDTKTQHIAIRCCYFESTQ